MTLRDQLLELQEPKYRKFTAALMPGVENVLGIRLPVLRKYARMAVAWAVSVCYVKFPQRTHEWLGSCSLDDWTFNKSLQKIVESLRVSDTDKQAIRAMKRRKQAASRAAVNPRPGTETAGQAEKQPGQAAKQPTDGKTAARRRRPAEKQGARHRFAK